MNVKNYSNIEDKKLSESKSVEVQDPLINENSSASSFLATLQLMQKNRSTPTNASTSSSSSSLSNPLPIAVKEIDIEKITMKPFLFFDLLTSKDSSGSDRQASQSLSNIGKCVHPCDYVRQILCSSTVFSFQFDSTTSYYTAPHYSKFNNTPPNTYNSATLNHTNSTTLHYTMSYVPLQRRPRRA